MGARTQAMIDAVQILWSPTGVTLSALDPLELVDVTDGDTPNVRLLSVDTPEVTARTDQRAQAIDQEFAQLAEWIGQGRAPISRPLAEVLLPKLTTGRAGSLQLQQGRDASAFAKQRFQERLTRPDGSQRKLFIRMADSPFDDNGRLLAYVAPNYTEKERRTLTRAQRATFNLDLVEAGHAAPFVIYPSVPGELDLPLLLEAASAAVAAPQGIWANPETLLAYEYRAAEKLFQVTRKIVNSQPLKPGEARSWRERYCVDLRTRSLHGPEDYFGIAPEYRLWIWPRDLNEAIGRLNLVPSPRLVGTQ